MEFKGTKGKWKFVHTNQHQTEKNEWHSVVQIPKIAISITNTKFLSKQETEANALLISKAPEMLEILKIILEGKCDIPEWKKEMAKQLIKETTEL